LRFQQRLRNLALDSERADNYSWLCLSQKRSYRGNKRESSVVYSFLEKNLGQKNFFDANKNFEGIIEK
jgi:hypothetical protein